MQQEKIACIGTGVMGSALTKAVVKVVGQDNVIVYDVCPEKAESLGAECGCFIATAIDTAVKSASFVFLAVKPAIIPKVAEEIAPDLKDSAVVVSVAAGVKIESVKAHLRGNSVIRIMPNAAASCATAMTAICASGDTPPERIAALQSLLAASGRAEIVPEVLMDAVTGVSGSGPAFGLVFIEAMADAAVLLGMPRAQAIIFAAQTLKGAAELVLAGEGAHPAVLKDAVCSPGGTTIAGIAALEEAGFRNAVIKAVKAAAERSAELG